MQEKPKSMKVIIVEDEEAHLELMERTIRRDFPDVQIYPFVEIESCLNSIDQINPDVIITDYLLPGIDGLEFLEELHKKHRGIPVVVTTGQGDENIAVKAMKLGAGDYVVKSGDFFSLLPSIIKNVVHQEELKKALQESQALYEREKNKLNYVLASMQDPLAAINEDMTIDFVNAVFEKIFGKELKGKPYQVLFGESSDACFTCLRAVEDRQTGSVEFEDVNERIWHVTISPGIEKKGDIFKAVLIFRDITEGKRAEEELRETRNYLANLIDHANAPIIVWDPEFRITRFNHAFEHLTGKTAKGVLGLPLDILFPENRRAEAMAHIHRTIAGERWEAVEIPILGADGAVRTVLWNSATLYAADGTTAVATIAQGQDISERKAYEKQLQHLSERMICLQEEERSRISRELHDELAQVVTALKFDAVWLKGHLSDEKIEVKERFQEMCALIDGSLGAVRRISSDLRPGILDDMGLGAAVEWYALDFGRRSGLECVTLIDLPERRLAGHLETGIYRIVQEALTNVARHAKASTVTISMKQNEKTLFVQIVDNGMGIEPSKIQSPLSTGISGMRERTEILSGSMEIKSDPGKGTQVKVQVPVMYR